MKIALMSDVHGNLPALQAVIQDLEQIQPEMLVVAGDLIAGPHPNEVLQVLRDSGATIILGNSDNALLCYLNHQCPDAWYSLKQFGLLRWNASHVSKENVRYLASLPEQTVITLPGLDAIRVVHGSPRDIAESLFPEKDRLSLDLALQYIAEPVLVCGHTHQPWFLRRTGKLAVNPGAVAGPLNGDIGAQYAIIEWHDHQWQVTLKKTNYDLSLIKIAFEESGLLKAGGPVTRGFLLSMETGRDVTLAFLNFAFELANKAGYTQCKYLPDQILDQADQEFPWNTWKD